MNKFRLIVIALTLAVFTSCSTDNNNNKKDLLEKFTDNGVIVDSLRNAYKCEQITLDKWDATGVTDSTFSFCFVNAKILPSIDPDSQAKAFKDIARAIKTSIKNTDRYNSIQIVFVESDKVNKTIGPLQSHRLGGVINFTEL